MLKQHSKDYLDAHVSDIQQELDSMPTVSKLVIDIIITAFIVELLEIILHRFLITCDNFSAIGKKTSILWRVKNGGFLLTKPVAIHTRLRNCAPYDISLQII